MTRTFKPTLSDVARAAGVSTATVSRCLNVPGLVVPKTRKRVLNAVRELGYTPDFGGRALASRRTDTVGAVIPTMENAIFARGLQAFQETLSESGITLLVASSGYNTAREADQIRTLVSRGADGLLLIGSARPKSTYEYLHRRGIPYVLTWNLGNTDDHYIGFDNARAAEEITAKVIEYGHRAIAMIAGITCMNDRASDRVAGVKNALLQAGLEVASLRVIEAAYTIEDGADALETLVKSDPRPTAVICGNDVLAVGAVNRAKTLGLNVPGDISVTGFDDIDIASVIEPALTTIHVPHRRMGSAAAHTLLRKIAGEETDRKIGIGVELTIRGSLGPPPVR